MFVVGVDPDAEKHGVAVYHNGSLKDLMRLNTVELIQMIKDYHGMTIDILVSLENVTWTRTIYRRNKKASKAVECTVANSVGKCQQAQVELMRWLDHLGVKYVTYDPQKSNWAKDRKRFEFHTGWSGKSNEDTRSAAYFGFVASR